MPYPDRFYPVVDSVAWVARLAKLGVGTVQLRAKDLDDGAALQIVTDALEVTRGTPTKLVLNDYWRAAIVAGATHILLDNMAPTMLAEAVALVAGRAATEASGGVRLDTIGAVAASGVDYVSVGRLMQSAPAADIGLDFELV